MSIGSFYSDIEGNADIIMEPPPVKLEFLHLYHMKLKKSSFVMLV